MLNLNVDKKDVEDRAEKKRMTTKQALSMQATIQNAMANRAPQNPNGTIDNQVTSQGFGRTI